MKITWLHMSITVLIAITLHVGIAMWFSLSSHAPLKEPPALPLRVSLLAAVEKTTVNTSIQESQLEPISEPVLTPTPAPKPAAKPVIQEVLLEPFPSVKPMPEPQPPTPEPQPSTPRPVNSAPETEQSSKPVQEMAQPVPAAPSVAPLDVIATARYEQLLVAWLERHKKYPRRAKRLRIEGKGMLRILIDRTGRTQQVTLEQRTGNRLLDQAALKMAQRADPFPPIPDNDSRRELEFIIPVVFALR